MIGLADGDTCGRKGCDGIIGEHPPDNCSCHTNPPCGACTSPRFFCPTCGIAEADDDWEIAEDVETDRIWAALRSVCGGAS